MEPIHFFRAGRHVSSSGQEITFSEDDIRAIASQYNPSIHEAPLVVGHPTTDAPAYGWIKAVSAREDGLYAVPDKVQPEFAEVVRSGAYKKVSGSFYPPNAKNNPRPGSYYLRHVGFLGAAAPAIKGLRPVSFAEDAEAVDFQEHTLDLREHRLSLREAAMSAREASRRMDEDARFVEDLILGGRLPIGLKDMTVALFAELDDRAVSFREGGEERTSSPRALLRDVMAHMPQAVATGEFAGGALPMTASRSSPRRLATTWMAQASPYISPRSRISDSTTAHTSRP